MLEAIPVTSQVKASLGYTRPRLKTNKQTITKLQSYNSNMGKKGKFKAASTLAGESWLLQNTHSCIYYTLCFAHLEK